MGPQMATWIATQQMYAAWTQAVGSLLLIGFSVWQVWRISRERERERRQDHVAFLDLVRRMVCDAADEFEILRVNLEQGFDAGVWFHSSQAEAQGYLHLRHLDEIPLERWPSLTLFSRVQNLLASMKNAAALAEVFREPEDPKFLGLSREVLLKNELSAIRSHALLIESLIKRLQK